MSNVDISKLVTEIRKKINKYNNSFDSYTSIDRYANYKNPEDEYEEKHYYEEKMKFDAVDIHYLFLTLFDLSKSRYMKDEYTDLIGSRYKSSEELTKGTYYDLPDDVFSDLSGDFHNFLHPLEVLYQKEIEVDSRKSKLEHRTLERLLKETNLLCKLSSTKPNSEPRVYNAVKQYLYILFPKANNVSGQTFPSIAKVYKPDIIVPECNAAIEYKYIDKEEKVSSTIAGISDDVVGYKKNTDYQYFYAVFYFKYAYVTRERFLEIWKERKFPINWKPIYVVETN